MSDEIEQARDDLAFMRGLAEAPDHPNAAMGQALFAAGLIYGIQTLIQWAESIGLIALPHPYYFIVVAGGSVLFLSVLAYILWRARKTPLRSVSGRAYDAAFQAAGLANLAIVLVFTATSIRSGDFSVWLLHAPVVFALQGGAWFVGFRLRKRAWLGLVAVGWFAAAIGLGLTTDLSTYILVTSISLFLLLGLPGWIMLRLAGRAAE
jgi:hypothetical protein